MTEWSSDVMNRDLQVLETGQPVMNVEDKLSYVDGRVEYFLTSKAPLFDAGNAVVGVITVAVDITPQKQAETERRVLEQQLQHAQKIEALGQLAGGVAHDLNNALVPVLAMTELVLQDLPAGSSDRGLLQLVLAGAKRARELVGQILAFSRREQASRHEFDLTDIAGEALMMLRASIPSTIALVDHIEPALSMMGDPGQLHQVLVNLVVNAAQAIGDRQGTVTVRAERESDGSHIRLSVADTGCGMDGVTRERVFEPFFTTKEVGKGTGLGLSIVHGIVTNHGGTIAVESAPGQGTRFDILLPTGLECTAPELLVAS
jgi:two-component system cell cycle sensor histidine kinase/response regulator CckA